MAADPGKVQGGHIEDDPPSTEIVFEDLPESAKTVPQPPPDWKPPDWRVVETCDCWKGPHTGVRVIVQQEEWGAVNLSDEEAMTRPSEDSPARAGRLRIALALCAGIPYLDPNEAAQQGLVPLAPGDLGLLAETLTDDDLALVNACLELEQDLRERGYGAIERLAARLAWEDGTLDERVTALPAPAAMGALSDLYEAGLGLHA